MIRYILAKVIKKIRLSAIKNCHIHKTSTIESGGNLLNVTMGRYSFCGYNCEIANADIGSFCSIANGVIIGGGMHPLDWVATSPVFYEGKDSVKAKFSEHKRNDVEKIIIEHDVWIGQNVLIKQGVKIGTGAIVGMGSVVTKDVQSYSIYAGNPSKLIRYRFDEVTIEKLLASKWWVSNDNQLLEYASFFKDPKCFLRAIEDEKNINSI